VYLELDAGEGVAQALLNQSYCQVGYVDPDPIAAQLLSRVYGRAAAAKWIKDNYWNDLLIVRSLTLANSIGDQERDEYTLIPPVFRELTPDDIRLAPIPQLAAPIVAHQITFRGLDQNVYTVTRTDFRNSAGFKVLETSLPHSKHKIEIHFADQFITETAAEIHRLMQR
jgi:hypothetical protein